MSKFQGQFGKAPDLSSLLKLDQTTPQKITATDTTITASDEVYFGDVTDSSKIKKDTVQGILDLVPSSTPDLSSLGDVIDTDKATGKILQVRSDGDHEYVTVPSPDLSAYMKKDGSIDFTGEPNQYIEFLAGEALVAGNICYTKGSPAGTKAWKAKADDEATVKGRMLLCTETISAGATGTFLVRGYYEDTGLTRGATYYVDASTAGAKTLTVPSTSTNIIRILGWGDTTTSFYFEPSTDYGEVA